MTRRRSWAAGCVALLWIVLPLRSHAQVADSALAERYLARGWTREAEDELYGQLRRTPEDPAARGALGAYLAARGRFRVGATLLEEARRFGGDPYAIAVRLAPIYHWLRDWDALDALPASPLSAAERARAQWLQAHPMRVDTRAAGTARARRSGASIWPQIEIRVDGRVLWAEVDPQVLGLELADAPRARRFGRAAAGEVAIVDSLVVGGVVVTQVPTLIHTRRMSRLGLDLFVLLSPVMSAAGETLTVGRTPAVAADARRDTAIVTLGFPGAMFTLAGAPGRLPSEAPALRRWVDGHRWWFDASRGVAVRVSGMP